MKTDKLKILIKGFNTVKEDEAFVAYHLIKYQAKFRLSMEDICKMLKIDEDRYYSLGLAKFPQRIDLPTGKQDTFKYRVSVIAEYIECDAMVLENLLSN